MDIADLPARIEDLEANIDELTTHLTPLLSQPLSHQASTLPLLSRAKLAVLTAYTIESLIFSSLLTSGIDAKQHAVFQELGRLKSYFKKIKDAELGPEPKTRLDKEAAGRFIRHGLAGNERYDRERRERIEREKNKGRGAGQGKHIKFDEAEESKKMEVVSKKRAAEDETVGEKGTDADADAEETAEHDLDSENEELYGAQNDTASTPKSTSQPAKKKLRTSTSDAQDPSSPSSPKKSKLLRRAEKRARRAAKNTSQASGKEEETILPVRAPRTYSETFNALLDGSLSKSRTEKGKGKGRGK